MKKFFAILSLVMLSLVVGAREVDPKDAVIVIPKGASRMLKFAAAELQKHLRLICGQEIAIESSAPSGKYVFQLGVNPDNRPLKPEEAVWIASDSGVVIFGDDDTESTSAMPLRSGTLYALYDFLEKNFHFIWLYPGDKGIQNYTESAKLNIPTSTGNWIPELSKRGMRARYGSPFRLKMPRGMEVTHEGDKPNKDQILIWLKRQRMGSSETFRIQHAYTQWWNRFHKTHPEYFALRHTGKRELLRNKTSTVKLCVSNPAVADQIVADWMAQNPREHLINVEENDWGGFCTCENCRALDAPLPGEPTLDPKYIAAHPDEESNAHLTDRYVHLANEVLKRARKIDPTVLVGMYAYGTHRMPPRREKVDPDMVLGVASSMGDLEEAKKLMDGWHKAGVRRIFLRPNDHHHNIGLPLGFEKRMYDHFELARSFGAFGDDWDSLYSFWTTTGIADYILARKHVTPGKSFEELEDEYVSAYGSAAPEIKEYYRFWRHNIWDERLVPNMNRLASQGRYGNVSRGCVWYIKEYFFESDFDQTDAILQRAAAHKDLNSRQRQLVRELILSNEHIRMTYHAMGAPKDRKLEEGKKLLAWREKHKNDFPMSWLMVNFVEQRYGDVTGAGVASAFVEFREVLKTNNKWFFKLDPKDVGLKEHWGKLPAKVWKEWPRISIVTNWELAAVDKSLPASLSSALRNYDGIGWYAWPVKVPKEWKGSEVYLYFGAVDEDATVFIDGKLAGTRPNLRPNDWMTPFTIRIDDKMDWSRGHHQVLVRVKDESGNGGIYKGVMVVRK